jgi:hypothetical protein
VIPESGTTIRTLNDNTTNCGGAIGTTWRTVKRKSDDAREEPLRISIHVPFTFDTVIIAVTNARTPLNAPRFENGFPKYKLSVLPDTLLVIFLPEVCVLHSSIQYNHYESFRKELRPIENHRKKRWAMVMT